MRGVSSVTEFTRIIRAHQAREQRRREKSEVAKSVPVALETKRGVLVQFDSSSGESLEARQRKRSISAWVAGAVVDVAPTPEIRERAKELMALGVKAADAIHLACAESAECDWFFTVDRGILKKVHELGKMRIANPVEFVLEGMK